MIILCGLVFISMIVFCFFWRGDIALLFLSLMFLGIFIFLFDYINVRTKLEFLNDFLVDNSAYVNNNSLKYYDKDREKSVDTLFKKHIDYIYENKIQVSLSKFDEDTCKNIIKFMNSSSEVNSWLFRKEYAIKMDTLISDENIFCKNEDNKITYTININDKNKERKL